MTGQIEKQSGLMWSPHPLIDADPNYRKLSDDEFALLAEQCGEDSALEYFRSREKRIEDSFRDPFKYEFPLPHWADVEDMVCRKTLTFIPGGNNPGKSWWSGSLVMRFLLRRFTWDGLGAGKLKVLMIAQDDDASKMFQQPAVYAHFPLEWRIANEAGKKPAGFSKCINYSDKNGFTEGAFVLPPGGPKGQCWFKTVAQYTREPKSFEGPAYDLVIIDEGCPLPLLEALLGRAAKVGGRVIYLLTCVHGYDQAMGRGLEGARVIKSLPMQWQFGNIQHSTFNTEQPAPKTGGINPQIVFPELKLGEHQTDLLKRLGVPAGHMPYMMQPVNPNWGVIFMWNFWNPFQPPGKWVPPGRQPLVVPKHAQHWGEVPGALPSLFDSCVGQAKWRVIVKIFGWVEKVGQLAVGNFNPSVHIVRDEQREALDKLVREGKCTVYMSDDPETQRSHAILWQATLPSGQKYVFDESPRGSEGEWVNGNGDRGEGQYAYSAVGANFYKRHIRGREREWNIKDQLESEVGLDPGGHRPPLHPCVMLRRGDPRGFATEESTATGTRSMFELYLEDHSAEHPDCGPMVFMPAKLRRSSSLDLDNIINLLRYDQERYEREGSFSAENRPMLLVSERCENLIHCILNYTLTDLGRSDEDNPFRDFIDSWRYLNSGETPYVDLEKPLLVGGGSWG